MAYADIAGKINYPRGLSQRYRSQDRLLRFLEGTLYDDAKLSPFDQEYTGFSTGTYIKLRERRPSVVSNFARQFVEQTIGLLWADEQFPVIRCYKSENPDEQDTDAEKQIQHLVEACAFDELLSRATYLGSIGSAAVVVRGLSGPIGGEPWFEVWSGYKCVPVFDDRNPNVLTGLATIYSASGESLKLAGYDIKADDEQQTFWLRIDLNAQVERRYKPLIQDRFERLGEKDEKTGDIIKWVIDEEYPHNFGVVPAVWGRSPNAGFNDLDGPCVFGAAADTIVELDYQLSQIGRAYKFTADPLLAIRRGELNINQYSPGGSKPNTTGTDSTGKVVRDVTNTIDVEAGGDAKLLEISGSGLTAALDYVQKLREYALESIGGMKSDSETQKGAQSGRALELLYQALVIVVKRLRLAWGNRMLLPLVNLTLTGIQRGELVVPGVKSLDPRAITMRLKWPNWMTPTGADFAQTVQGWQALAGGSAKDPVPILPRDTVTRLAATNLGFQDAEALVAEIEKQQDADAQDDIETQEAQLKLQAQHAPDKPNGAK